MCHCERSEAISILIDLDCRVAMLLAMTNHGHRHRYPGNGRRNHRRDVVVVEDLLVYDRNTLKGQDDWNDLDCGRFMNFQKGCGRIECINRKTNFNLFVVCRMW